jgi:HNH endonuclease
VVTLIQYGLARDFAERVHGAGLTVTSARATSIKNLVSKYGFSSAEATELRKCVDREPIDPEVVNRLLLRGNFTCSLCKGQKGVSYVIHHIVEYEKTQDNRYENLIVVCPNDHDLAHQTGLTLRITADQLRNAKTAWEREVEIRNAERAVQREVVHSNTFASSRVGQTRASPTTRQSLEMLPQLRAKYPRYLRPEMTSVQFVQSQDRCYLEITTVTGDSDYLVDETSMRTDLAFITSGSGLSFSPERPIAENVHCFIENFDEVSIINCTDLFTEEAATRIDTHWRQFHTIPSGL